MSELKLRMEGAFMRLYSMPDDHAADSLMTVLENLLNDIYKKIERSLFSEHK